MCKLALAAGVYFIWVESAERNSRKYLVEKLNIDDNIRLWVYTWKHFPSSFENQIKAL